MSPFTSPDVLEEIETTGTVSLATARQIRQGLLDLYDNPNASSAFGNFIERSQECGLGVFDPAYDSIDGVCAQLGVEA